MDTDLTRGGQYGTVVLRSMERKGGSVFKKPWWLGPVLIAAATVGAALVAAGGVLGHSVGRYRGSRAEQRRHARDAALKEEERAKVRRGNGELPKPTPSDEGAA